MVVVELAELQPSQLSWFQFYQRKICQEDNSVRESVGKQGSLNFR